MNYYGGETGNFVIHGNAKANLQGGRIDYIGSFQYVPTVNNITYPHIEMVVREYDDSNPNLVTGVWNVDNDSDGEYDPFSINLIDQSGYDPVIENITFTIIPEPMTLLFFGFGGLTVRRLGKRIRLK